MGKEVIQKHLSQHNFKGVKVRTICMVGGDLKGVATLAPPIKTAFTKKTKKYVNNLNIKYSFNILIFSILSILFPVFNIL